jgi:hypothetical protein
MALIVTGAIARMVLAWAKLRTAKALGLAEADDTTVPPYVAALTAASPAHAAGLNKFKHAYAAWWRFHAVIDAVNKAGSSRRRGCRAAALDRRARRRPGGPDRPHHTLTPQRMAAIPCANIAFLEQFQGLKRISM